MGHIQPYFGCLNCNSAAALVLGHINSAVIRVTSLRSNITVIIYKPLLTQQIITQTSENNACFQIATLSLLFLDCTLM